MKKDLDGLISDMGPGYSSLLTFKGVFLFKRYEGGNGVWEELWMSYNPTFTKFGLLYSILSCLNNCILRLTCLINFFTPGLTILLISLDNSTPKFI